MPKPEFTPTHVLKIHWPGQIESREVELIDGNLYTREEAENYEAADWTLEHDENGEAWLAWQGKPSEKDYRPAELWTLVSPRERIA
jgi:hypothetical protein